MGATCPQCFGSEDDDQLGRYHALAAAANDCGRYERRRPLEEDFEVQDNVPALGSGASGDVRLALLRSSCGSEGRFAIKTLSKAVVGSGAMCPEREVQIFLSLDHPNIARLQRVYESDDKYHLLMELCEGGTLHDRLMLAGRFLPAAAAAAMRQVMLAVSYLHGNNVVHRDLKLENLIYEFKASTKLKLIDFGYAVRWNGKSCMTEEVGSLWYLAPEVLNGSYTEKVDVWSAGVVAHMLLVNQAPIEGERSEVLQRIFDGKISWSKVFGELPQDARYFVQQLLNSNMKRRPGADKALQLPWLVVAAAAAAADDSAVYLQYKNRDKMGLLFTPIVAVDDLNDVNELEKNDEDVIYQEGRHRI